MQVIINREKDLKGVVKHDGSHATLPQFMENVHKFSKSSIKSAGKVAHLIVVGDVLTTTVEGDVNISHDWKEQSKAASDVMKEWDTKEEVDRRTAIDRPEIRIKNIVISHTVTENVKRIRSTDIDENIKRGDIVIVDGDEVGEIISVVPNARIVLRDPIEREIADGALQERANEQY